MEHLIVCKTHAAVGISKVLRRDATIWPGFESRPWHRVVGKKGEHGNKYEVWEKVE